MGNDMKLIRLTVIPALVLLTAGLSAQSPSDTRVELQFFQQTYRLNEPMNVLINVVNVSSRPLTFMVSPLIYETFFFDLRSPRNEAVPLLDPFEVEMKTGASSSGDYRSFTLLPQESYSRVIDITKWFDIRESGHYFIRGYFYSNPDRRNARLESFDYKILIKPPMAVEQKLTEEQQVRRAEMETARKLPPYDVIADLLDAKMKKDWERFLAHIDAERLIVSFTEFYSAYDQARSGRYRLEVLEEFKDYLTKHWQDRILSYQVLESQIKDDRASVVCDVVFKVRTLDYTLRYTFSLYKNHNQEWLVQDYTALKVK